MAASAVDMARLIALGQGFPELVPPEVPRQLVVPAAVVTKENVNQYEKYAFNSPGFRVPGPAGCEFPAGPGRAPDDPGPVGS